MPPAPPRPPSPSLGRRACLAGSAAAVLAAGAVQAGAGWPDHPVRLIVFSAPGAGMDVAGRALAEALGRRWGQPVVVDNRPGADGILAIEALLAARDGHALLYGSRSMTALLPLMHDRLPFDLARDVVPVSLVTEDFITVVAAPSLPADSLDGVVALARAKPAGALTYATVAGAPYLASRAFQAAAEIEMTLVSYRNPPAAILDLTQGRLDLALSPLATIIGQAQAGQVKLLAIAGPNRAPSVPGIPTVAEAGYPDLAIDAGNGLYAQRQMPEVLRERIAQDVGAVLAEPEVARRLAGLGYVPRGAGPAEFAASLEAMRGHWGALARTYGARPAR